MSDSNETTTKERGIVKSAIYWKDVPCWIWPRGLNAYGYGIVSRRNVSPAGLVHVILYVEFRGEIPEGFELDHLCRNTKCVNPWHMEAVTHRKNIRRGVLHTKLTQEHLYQIRDCIDAGWTDRYIAEEFDVTSTRINQLRQEDRWNRNYREEGLGKWLNRPKRKGAVERNVR